MGIIAKNSVDWNPKFIGRTPNNSSDLASHSNYASFTC